MKEEREPGFEILYKQFGPMVYRRCRGLLGSDEEAKDYARCLCELIRRYDLSDKRLIATLHNRHHALPQ